jgi:hypothetical protein
MDNIFINIEKSDKETKFIYFVIIILILAIFTRINIKLNIVFACFMIILIISYLSTSKTNQEFMEKDILDNKKKLLRLKNKKIEEYPELVNFLFSIQDFYRYNPPSYEEMIFNLNDFILAYEQALLDNKLAGINYKLCDNFKINILNSLHAIIYNLPDNKEVINKLNESINEFENILTLKMDELFDINKKYIMTNGYNNQTVIINKKIREYNLFDENKPYTYKIFG